MITIEKLKEWRDDEVLIPDLLGNHLFMKAEIIAYAKPKDDEQELLLKMHDGSELEFTAFRTRNNWWRIGRFKNEYNKKEFRSRKRKRSDD